LEYPQSIGKQWLAVTKSYWLNTEDRSYVEANNLYDEAENRLNNWITNAENRLLRSNTDDLIDITSPQEIEGVASAITRFVVYVMKQYQEPQTTVLITFSATLQLKFQMQLKKAGTAVMEARRSSIDKKELARILDLYRLPPARKISKIPGPRHTVVPKESISTYRLLARYSKESGDEASAKSFINQATMIATSINEPAATIASIKGDLNYKVAAKTGTPPPDLQDSVPKHISAAAKTIAIMPRSCIVGIASIKKSNLSLDETADARNVYAETKKAWGRVHAIITKKWYTLLDRSDPDLEDAISKGYQNGEALLEIIATKTKKPQPATPTYAEVASATKALRDAPGSSRQFAAKAIKILILPDYASVVQKPESIAAQQEQQNDIK
jgi:hypothetical protein